MLWQRRSPRAKQQYMQRNTITIITVTTAVAITTIIIATTAAIERITRS